MAASDVVFVYAVGIVLGFCAGFAAACYFVVSDYLKWKAQAK